MTHVVRSGDTIARLCWFYRVRAETIRAANPGLKDPLPVGRPIVIPLEGGATSAGPAVPTPLHPPAAASPDASATRAAFLAAVQAPTVAPPAPPSRPVPHETDASASPAARAAKAGVPVKSIAVTATAGGTDKPPVVATTRLPPPPADVSRVAAQAVTVVSADGSQAPAPGVLVRTAAGGRAASATPNFEDAARWLIARNIRYNEDWIPPGEHEPWSMDCSNTVRWLYRTVAGVDLPRTAADQYEFLRRKGRAWEVPPDNDGLPDTNYIIAHLRMGDLLFWENTYEPVRHPNITHVMILLGEDEDHHWKMTGSQTRDGVSIYEFDPQATKGGYTSLLGNVYHPGRFVAYGRP